MSLEKNQTAVIEAGTLNSLFESVTEIEGTKLVCSGLLPGEKAEVKIVKAGKNISFGKVINVLEPDNDRVTPECRNEKCTGCGLIFASYQKQLEMKKENISGLYGRNIDVIPSLQYGYRNRAILPVGKEDGKVTVGIYRNNSHDLTDWTFPCPVLSEKINSIISEVRTALNDVSEEKLPEQLFIRGAGNSYQAGFIIKEPSKFIDTILSKLKDRIPELESVFYSLSTGTNSVLVKDPVFTAGADHCVLETSNGSYSVSPGSFFQANIFILNKILDRIRNFIEPGTKVLDLYSGCGVLSDFPGAIRTCVESNASSFGFLEANGSLNLISADASEAAGLTAKGDFDIIIADPPRKGIDHETLEAIDSSSAHTFIYLSCEPKTQKRDIELLKNFEISEITAYDMFPNTVHIESLAILKRKAL